MVRETGHTRGRKAETYRVVSVWVALLALAVLSCVPDAPDGDIPTGLSVQEDAFSVTLAWDAPTQDSNGGPLSDLAGYRFYYSRTTPPDGPDGTLVEVVETRHTATDLAAGTWYFAVTAVDEAGNESALSDAVAVEVGGP